MNSINYLHIGGGKIPALSTLRLFAMILIISCHFCQFYGSEWAWWLNVGVQIFFVLSGFLYGSKNINEPIEWLIKQFVKILIPYYAFLFIVIALYAIACPQNLPIVNVIGSFFCISTLKGIGHLWFVGNILFCYLLTPYLAAFMEYCKKWGIVKVKLLFIMLVICCIISVVGVFTQAYFRPGNILCYIAGYFISVFYQQYGLKAITRLLWLSLPFTLFSNMAYVYEKYVLHNPMNGIWIHLTDYSHLFLGLTLTLLLMLLFNHIRMNTILSWSDKYSYTVYLVHQLFILSPMTLLNVFDAKIYSLTLTIFIIFISGVLLKALSTKLEYVLFLKEAGKARL